MPKVYNKRHQNAPSTAVYIGRPGRYGNPFPVEKYGRDQAIAKFEHVLMSNPHLIEMVKKELRGKDLVCWCSPAKCHGDVLLRIANQD